MSRTFRPPTGRVFISTKHFAPRPSQQSEEIPKKLDRQKPTEIIETYAEKEAWWREASKRDYPETNLD